MELKHVRKRDALILGGTFAVAVVGLGFIHRGCTYQDVWLVNGLDLPVEVEVDGARHPVAANARVEVTVHEGVHQVRVLSTDGKVIEEGPVDVPARTDVVAYNVAGAAPLYLASIKYTRYANPKDNDQGSVEVFAGTRVIARDNVNFIFKEPPSSISVKSGESTTRYRFDQADGGWRMSAGYLESKGESSKMAQLFRATTIAGSGARELVDRTSDVLELAEGTPAVLRFLREMRALRPDDAGVHMEYQYRMHRLGRGEEVLAEYRELHAKNQDSPLYSILLARIEPREQATLRINELVERYPNEVQVLSSAAHHAFVTGDYLRAVELYERFQDKPEHERSLQNHIASLLALGRVPDALALVSRYAAAAPVPDTRVALLFALVARLPGAVPATSPKMYIERLAGAPNGRDWTLFSKAFLGEPLSATDLVGMNDPDLRTAIEIHLATLKDPAGAWERCASITPPVLRLMAPGTSVLLAAEFYRAGDPELAARLLERDVGLWVPNEAIFEYIRTGTKHPNFWRMDPELRAALALVRFRHITSQGDGASAVLAEAEKLDFLKLVVAPARASWPPVEPPAAPVKKPEKPAKPNFLASSKNPSSGVLRRVPKPAP